MPLNQALLSEFENEAKGTRKTLERIPEDKWDWAPHPKSMKMGALAKHLADMPGWTVNALTQDSIDVAPEGKPMQTEPARNRKEVLALFDKIVAAGRKALAAANDDAQWMKPWALLMTGKTIFSMPRVAVIRSFVMNHGIHHRAQLGVYLRLNNVPVPAIYGPSADENTF